MLGRTTRLEFIIVTIAFLVLMLCSKPPRPGSADVGHLNGQSPPHQDATPVVLPEEPVPLIEADAPGIVQSEGLSTNGPAPQSGEEAAGTERQVARLATVDARNCSGLKYDSVMQGEVTVRWVWDGQRFVPQKVCVVEGPDGRNTVWGFEQQGEAVLSEVQTPSDSGR
jgi:hypothetical protein